MWCHIHPRVGYKRENLGKRIPSTRECSMCEDYYSPDEKDAWTRTLERTRESQRTIRGYLQDLSDRQELLDELLAWRTAGATSLVLFEETLDRLEKSYVCHLKRKRASAVRGHLGNSCERGPLILDKDHQ